MIFFNFLMTIFCSNTTGRILEIKSDQAKQEFGTTKPFFSVQGANFNEKNI